MPNLISIIDDTFPANNDVGVPLRAQVTILFSDELDEELLEENFFLEGPDTDLFVGPGVNSLQSFPDNVSQGEEFLESPGLRGFVQGTFEFKKIDVIDPDLEVTVVPYRTKMIFTPDKTMAALTEYKAHVYDLESTDSIMYTGHVIFSFTTGTGSIQEVPSTSSTSVLSSLNPTSPLSTLTPVTLIKATPADNSVNIETTLQEIVLEFNKDIDLTSAENNIQVEAFPAIEHPNLTIAAAGPLAREIEVSGKHVKIKI